MEKSEPDWVKWIKKDDTESIKGKDFDVNEIWKTGSDVSSFFPFSFFLLCSFSRRRLVLFDVYMANLNLKKWTPLGYAINERNKEIVEILLQKGADPNTEFVSACFALEND